MWLKPSQQSTKTSTQSTQSTASNEEKSVSPPPQPTDKQTDSAEVIDDDITVSVSTESQQQPAPAGLAESANSNMQEERIFEWFEYIKNQGRRRYVKCKACVKFPEIVKRHSRNRKVPAIAMDTGTINRTEVRTDHLKTGMHEEASKAYRQSFLNSQEILQKTPIGKCISSANLDLANKIGGLMIHTYTSSKRLTMSALTFATRVITGKVAENFSYNKPAENNDGKMFSPSEFDLQYTNPSAFRDFLQCIVETDRDNFATKFKSSLAASLRCDGSVDRTQIDKIYVMAKLIPETADDTLVFLGIAEPEERGAQGLLGAVKQACDTALGTKFHKEIFRNVSSVVTDGASVNIGDKQGLWKLLDDELRETGNEETVHSPLLKVWCVAHRSELAWKTLKKRMPEVETLIAKFSSVASFFRHSGVRTRELKEVAKKNKCALVHLPKYFEVRFTQFSGELITAILTSWHVLVLYFKQAELTRDSAFEARGYLKYLTARDTLQVATFLADVVTVFSR